LAGVAIRLDSRDTSHDTHCLADKLWLQRQLRIQVEEVELERRQRTIPDSGLVHIPVILLPRRGR
jgi:hypothetical protein